MEEKIYRWRKKQKTGAHYFKYNGEKHRVTAGKVVECPKRCVNACLEQYDCIGEIDKSGDVSPVDIDKLSNEDLDQEDDIKLEIHHLGKGWYDVYNPSNPDKPINTKALRRDDAYKLAGIEQKVNE